MSCPHIGFAHVGILRHGLVVAFGENATACQHRDALRELRHDLERRPIALLRWMEVARRNTRLNISWRELYRLALLTSQTAPWKVDNVTVPATLGWAGPESVVFIRPSAKKLYKRFRKNASL
jgi:hypothetical protein